MAAQQPVTNPTPKDRFQQSPENISKHRELVDSKEFQRAVDFAMLEYSRVTFANATLSNAEAMAAGYRYQGAIELLQTMRMLSESPVRAATVAAPKLDHNV